MMGFMPVQLYDDWQESWAYPSPVFRALGDSVGSPRQMIQTLKGDRAQDAPVSLDKLGPYRQVSLTKIQALSAKHLTHCWQTIPHVTQHDDLAIGALSLCVNRLKKI